MTVFLLAFKFFILMDSPGNIPLFTSIMKEIPLERQRKIIFRELLIALFVIIGFNFLGKPFLFFLDISDNTVKIAGGIILFLLSIKMVFPIDPKPTSPNGKMVEPFIVPLAIPLVAGPAVLAAVMIYSNQQQNHLIMMSSITLAWVASLIVLLMSPVLSRALGEKGVNAMERLMGLMLTLIAVEMFMQGLKTAMLDPSP